MKNRNSKDGNPHLFRGVVAGVAGGLAASWVMNLFIAGAGKAQEAVASPEEKAAKQADAANKSANRNEADSEDSTQKVASALAEATTGEPLNKQQKQKGGPIVHYAFGAIMGGIYGGLAEYSPAARLAFGTLFGSALFLGGDEIMVPALGLAPPPTQQPASAQVTHWIAHLVYGSTVETVRRVVRSVL